MHLIVFQLRCLLFGFKLDVFGLLFHGTFVNVFGILVVDLERSCDVVSSKDLFLAEFDRDLMRLETFDGFNSEGVRLGELELC